MKKILALGAAVVALAFTATPAFAGAWAGEAWLGQGQALVSPWNYWTTCEAVDYNDRGWFYSENPSGQIRPDYGQFGPNYNGQTYRFFALSGYSHGVAQWFTGGAQHVYLSCWN